MTIIKTSKGNWKLHGINLISSDSIYLTVKEAIETDNLHQDSLQKSIGHLGPITFDKPNKDIFLYSF